eukprot:GHVO01019925.1.p1 GENE.GHVO01019925.1~~GHVO01019925.1.p1  ORF type:complete len:220 (+),score=31.57 GHVO01019925.1:54-713(+)
MGSRYQRRVRGQIDMTLMEDESVDMTYSGCTASVALRYNSTVYVGYVGDSKVVGFHFKKNRAVRVMETPEHNPANAIESERIKSTGARISECFYRHLNKNVSRIVQAGISVSRAFGDTEARKFGLICDPDFVKFQIGQDSDDGDSFNNVHYRLILVVASDGLWDTFEPQEVLKYNTNAVGQSEEVLVNSLHKMVEIAWRRRIDAEGRADDTTAVIALLT